MSRPRCCYRIRHCPRIRKFKPEGVPRADIEVVEVSPEEAEALRLKNLKGFDQTEAAKEMQISQSTFQRILTTAYKKVTEAIIKGKAIQIATQKSK